DNSASGNLGIYEDVVNTQEPFNVVVRVLLTHPHVFSSTKKNDAESEDSALTQVSSSQSNGQSAVNDIYHVLLACYVWKALQVLLSQVLMEQSDSKDLEEEKKDDNDNDDAGDASKMQQRESSLTSPPPPPQQWQTLVQKKVTSDQTKDNLAGILKHLCFYVLPFLRKCYILLNSCGMVKLDLNVLWSCLSLEQPAILSAMLAKDPNVFQPENVMAECDAICDTFTFCTNRPDAPLRIHSQKKDDVLYVASSWAQLFFRQLTEKHCQYIRACYKIDSIAPISLITLPRSFHHLLA
ncbi:hypothetical protein RFI_27308, partial [Reticulomyxa filosa]